MKYSILVVFVVLVVFSLPYPTYAAAKSQKPVTKTNAVVLDKTTLQNKNTKMRKKKKNKKIILLKPKTKIIKKPTFAENIFHKGNAILQNIVSAVKNTFASIQGKIFSNNNAQKRKQLTTRKLRAQRKSTVRFRPNMKHKVLGAKRDIRVLRY